MNRVVPPNATRHALTVAVLLLLSPFYCHAQSSANSLTTQIVQLNQALVDTGNQTTTGGTQALPLVESLASLAQRRQGLLRNLIATSPESAAGVLLSDETVSRLPDSAKPFMEAAFQSEGTVDVLAEDIPHAPRTRFFFNHGTQKLEMFFAKNPPHHLTTGTKVRVSATQVDNVMLVASGGGDSTLSPELEVVASVLPNTFGLQSTAVVLVNFQDNKTQPFTASDINNVIFSTTGAWVLENSQNQTWLQGNVFGYYTLPMSIASCDFNTMTALADAAVGGAGVDLSGYQRIIYVSPLDASCGWEGAAFVGGLPSRAWINGTLALEVVAHELGHNFGLLHAHAQNCKGSTLADACQTVEYGDLFDVMGHTTSAHYNSFEKERLGWLGFGSSLPITTVTTSGTYALNPYASNLPGTRALKILKDSSSGIVTNYYVEFRQATGFDNDLLGFPTSTQGVIVHTGALQNANSSQLLDMNPQTSVFDDAALGVGQTFKDVASGVTLTTISVSPTQALVSVKLDPPACVQANPSVVITPAQGPSVSPGTVVSFSTTVTSNDSSTCTSATFHLRPFLPNNFTGSFTQVDLVIAPGGTATTTMNVASPTNAGSGAYMFSAFASNGGYAWLASASYNVNGGGSLSISALPPSLAIAPGSSAPVSVNASVAGGFSSSVALSATGLPDGVTAVFSPSSFVAPGSGSSTLTFTVGATAVSGNYLITITASAGGKTATSTVTLGIGTTAPPPSGSATPAPISQAGWKLLSVDSAETFCGNYAATNAFDGNSGTIWHTQYCPTSTNIPHDIQIDLGAPYNVAGFRYLPRQDGLTRGSIKNYEFYLSSDGLNWGAPIATGTLVTNPADLSQKQVLFSASGSARFVRLRALSEINGGPWTSMAELTVLASGNSGAAPTVFSVALNPNSTVGGSIVNGTVTLNGPAPAGGALVTLTSSLPNVASPIGSVMIPQSQASGNFTISTSAVVTSTQATITATYNNSFAKATVTVNPAAVPDFTVSANPTTVTVAPGSSVPSSISSAISGGLSASISLSASGLPTGVTASFLPTTIPAPGQGSTVLTLTASASTATGSYPVSIVASGGGLNRVTIVTLVVSTVPPPPPSATPISKLGWKLVSVDSAEAFCGSYPGSNAFDGSSATIWQSQYCVGSPNGPHEIQIDLGAVYDVDGFNYLPRQDGIARGKIRDFELYLSLDGQTWGTTVATGTLIANPSDSAQKTVLLSNSVSARYARLRAMSEVNGGPWASMAEIDILKK